MEAQKEMLARLIRYALLVVTGFLVSKGIVPADFAETWLTETTALIAMLVIGSIPFIWGHLKAKFDRKVVEAAVQLPPPAADTPAEVKAAVTEAKAIVAADDSVTVSY